MELKMCMLLEFKGFYAEIIKTTLPVLRVLCMALQWQTRSVHFTAFVGKYFLQYFMTVELALLQSLISI